MVREAMSFCVAQVEQHAVRRTTSSQETGLASVVVLFERMMKDAYASGPLALGRLCLFCVECFAAERPLILSVGFALTQLKRDH